MLAQEGASEVEIRDSSSDVPPRRSAEEDRALRRAVEAFQAGVEREKNFRLLVDRFYQPVKRFFSKRVFSAEDCLDLTQETFLRIYTGLDEFRGDARLSNWLFRIAYTTWLKWRERPSPGEPGPPEDGRPAPPGEPMGFEDGRPVAVSADRPQLEEVLHEERRTRLREAVDELPRKMRQCVRLRIYQDRSYLEIAAFLDISVETVKAHLGQAKKRLGRRLNDVFETIDLREDDP